MWRDQIRERCVTSLATGVGCCGPVLFRQFDGAAWWARVAIFTVVWLLVAATLMVWARKRDFRASEKRRARDQDRAPVRVRGER